MSDKAKSPVCRWPWQHRWGKWQDVTPPEYRTTTYLKATCERCGSVKRKQVTGGWE